MYIIQKFYFIFIVYTCLADEFDNVTFTDNFIVCEQDDDTSFTIRNSKVILLRFLFIREVIFCN
jgi:hypothetical protein